MYDSTHMNDRNQNDKGCLSIKEPFALHRQEKQFLLLLEDFLSVQRRVRCTD